MKCQLWNCSGKKKKKESQFNLGIIMSKSGGSIKWGRGSGKEIGQPPKNSHRKGGRSFFFGGSFWVVLCRIESTTIHVGFCLFFLSFFLKTIKCKVVFKKGEGGGGCNGSPFF